MGVIVVLVYVSAFIGLLVLATLAVDLLRRLRWFPWLYRNWGWSYAVDVLVCKECQVNDFGHLIRCYGHQRRHPIPHGS